MFVIEIAGNGSPYDFAMQDLSGGDWAWSVLFPEGDLRSMPSRRMAGAVERKLGELQPDVVMAGGIPYPSGAAAVGWARRNRRGVIIFDDARQEDVPRSPLVEFVKHRIYRNVDAGLIPARSHSVCYVHWGIARNRIYFGMNVVDNQRFNTYVKQFQSRKAPFRHERNLPQDFFLGVGRRIKQKNWKTCLFAYAKYVRKTPNSLWGLVLVGDGPEHRRLRRICDTHSIPNTTFPGLIVGEELLKYYASASAFVLPSTGETWGLVVNEAMACGLPVLVSNGCGCAHTLVHEGENAWTFSPEDPDELAARMLQMSTLSERERSKMCSASEEIVSSWGLDRFLAGAEAAILACGDVDRGFVSLLDRLLISLWNGRFRPA